MLGRDAILMKLRSSTAVLRLAPLEVRTQAAPVRLRDSFLTGLAEGKSQFRQLDIMLAMLIFAKEHPIWAEKYERYYG